MEDILQGKVEIFSIFNFQFLNSLLDLYSQA